MDSVESWLASPRRNVVCTGPKLDRSIQKEHFDYVAATRLPRLICSRSLSLPPHTDSLDEVQATIQGLSAGNVSVTVERSTDAPLWLATFGDSNCSHVGENHEASDDLEVRVHL